MRKSVQRGAVVAAALAGLCTSGTVAATAAQADVRPSADRTASGALGSVTKVTQGAHDALPAPGSAAQRTVRTGADAVRTGVHAVRGGAAHGPAAAAHGRGADAGKVVKSVRTARGSGEVRHGVGKAVTHVTKKAGAAVPAKPSGAPQQAAGHAVSGVETASSAASVPGMPKDYVIGVPKIVPGVPSIGIVPLSTPQLLPFTPDVPII